MMRPGDVEFVYDLVEKVPDLRPLLDEHLEDNYDQILPHLFLADVVRFAIEDVANPATRRALEHLEVAFTSGDEERQELISTGFVENLPAVGEPGDELRDRLGPALRAEAARVT
jgi:hypothetical protein